MNVVDAYVILENYVDSLAKGTRPNEQWRRVSLLKNSKEEILAAFKLVFAHAIFWNALPTETIEGYEQMVVHHLAWFRDDALIDEYVEVKRLLDNKSIFTKIRNKEIRASLEEKENRLVVQFNPVPDSMEYGRAVDEFIERLLPMIDATKKTLKQLSPDDLNKQYGNIIGNFVCDVYELANIDRDYNDTEYFWPFKHLYNLSQDPQFDHLFKRYKIIIANAYYNSMTDKKGNSP